MAVFICVLYAAITTCCAIGMYHTRYNANFPQRTALALLCIWCIGRVVTVSRWGLTYPGESVIALALGLLALGTVLKTIHYQRCKK